MDQTYLQQQAHQRLDLIHERADAICRYVQHCRKLVDKGLATQVEGLAVYEVVAQYSELSAMSATTIAVQADALTKQLRTLKP